MDEFTAERVEMGDPKMAQIFFRQNKGGIAIWQGDMIGHPKQNGEISSITDEIEASTIADTNPIPGEIQAYRVAVGQYRGTAKFSGGYKTSCVVDPVVTTNADSGVGSLRHAVTNACTGSSITFTMGAGFVVSPITLTTGEIVIDKNLTIQGPGANFLAVSGNAASRVFVINLGQTAGISGLTITGGNATDSGDDLRRSGGGIFSQGNLNLSDSVVTGNIAEALGGGIALIEAGVTTNITNSVISNNSGPIGGGIVHWNGTLNITGSTISGNSRTLTFNGAGGITNEGTMNLVNSTVSGNSVPSGTFNGGGLYLGSGSVSITSATVTNNSVPAGVNNCGGIRKGSGVVDIRNSLVAGNINNTTNPDVGGGFVSGGYNLIGNVGTATGFIGTGDQMGTGATPIDPVLGTLGGNGGLPQTHSLMTGSPAIDKGNAFGLTSDQRGLVRPFDDPFVPNAADGSDIGAFELQTGMGTPTPTSTPTATPTASPTPSCIVDPIVSTNADSGAGSLRHAVANACTESNITFAMGAGFVVSPITLTTGEIVIDKNLTIQGPGAASLTVSGSGVGRIFQVSSATNITGLTLSGGNGVGLVSNSSGGAILSSGNPLTLTSVHITGNNAANAGGGITITGGTANINDSSISNNTAQSFGGGIAIFGSLAVSINGSSISGNTTVIGGFAGGGIDNGGGFLEIINSTISGNTVAGFTNNAGGISTFGNTFITNSTISNNSVPADPNSAGGVKIFSGTVTVRSSIIGANQNNSSVADVSGAGFASQGYNLIGNIGTATGFTGPADQVGGGLSPVLDPLLASLANNGGPTLTHSLITGSPAIDRGNAFGLTSDQRGLLRPFDDPFVPNAADSSDIGAFELQTAATTPTPTATPTATPSATPTATPTSTPTATPTATPTPNTPVGINVVVQNADASITFNQVTGSGYTDFAAISPPTAGDPPAGYTFVAAGPAYNVTTTAVVVPPITVCFIVASVNDPTEFSQVRILHGESGQLIDRTILAPDTPAPNFATRTICARVSSLSPFVAALAPSAGAGFEGDVAPRPNGNGSVISGDVIQMRRFATGLDTPST
ncbi:MAG: choice-of-anchor Q domain-containing protein, partial [Pyrinomonadaceae bacterium]